MKNIKNSQEIFLILHQQIAGKHIKKIPMEVLLFHLLVFLLAGKYGKCKSLQWEKSLRVLQREGNVGFPLHWIFIFCPLGTNGLINWRGIFERAGKKGRDWINGRD